MARTETDISRDIAVCSEVRARIRFQASPSTDDLYEAVRLSERLDELFEERRAARSGATMVRPKTNARPRGSQRGGERDLAADLDFRCRKNVLGSSAAYGGED